MHSSWKFAAVALLIWIAIFVYGAEGTAVSTRTHPTADQSRHPPELAAASGSGLDNAQAPSGSPNVQTDLANLTATLYPRSEGGDGNASQQIASAYQECWLYAMNPIGFTEDMRNRGKLRPDLATKIAQASEITSDRCDGFAGKKIGPSAINAMLERAARQGNMAARTELFVQNAILKGATSEQIKSAAVDVLASGDPDAFAAIAPLMGAPSAGDLQALQPIPAGSPVSEAAWNIAACRLGRQCGPDSRAVLQMCLGGGINCELRDIQSFYEQVVLPPADIPKLRQLVGLLTQGAKQ
ncbi:hypothetical protein AB4Y64_03985 [Lysobacter sp. TAF61]|uniref:hypothetical protein n=1 Tax=Lysobacter sp. TAF61 TaxID=3233072 RepID=UPI003F9E9757